MRDDKAAEVGVMAALLPLVVAAVELEAGAVEETITEVKGAEVEVLLCIQKSYCDCGKALIEDARD